MKTFFFTLCAFISSGASLVAGERGLRGRESMFNSAAFQSSSTGSMSKSPAVREADQGVLDLNRATVEQLSTLPGIGPELARRIVRYREKHGPYRRVEELL